MLIYAANFLLGIMLFSSKNTLSILPLEWVGILATLLLIFALRNRYKITSISLGFLLLGFIWMSLFSQHNLNHQVPLEYLNKTINIRGTIATLPEKSKQNTKFIFNAKTPFEGKIKLTWYRDPPPLYVGDQWHLAVKLKRNHGYQNAGGFDYEKWLFYQKIDATGYVRQSADNQRYQKSKLLSIDKIRQNIRDALAPTLSKLEFGGIINAVIIGDRSLISRQNWTLFKNTNTTHLSVISGLHIGLISGFVFLLISFLWRQCQTCALRLPAQVMGSYFGLITALLYALIAGFSIPTQRAVIMASVVFLAIIFRRYHHTWQLYAIALLSVLVINPLSVFSSGFWLSFYVVGVIIYGLQFYKNKPWFYRLIAMQILISIATLPLIAWIFATGSVFSALANLIAIPIFSFIVIPISLIGALLVLLHLDFLAQIGFAISNQTLNYLAKLLHYLQNIEFSQWHYTQSSELDFVMLLIATILLISPKQLGFRKFSILIFALVLIKPITTPTYGSVRITTLDVGQGLSQVIRTKNHVLLFDTGATYRSGFNMGEAVIVPYLHTQQIRHLHKIIISHGDNDHIGGLKSVLQTFKPDEILSSVPHKIGQKTHSCASVQTWKWDGVLFQMLNTDNNFVGNNASCVLKISTDKYSILLSADIERKAEKHLIKTQASKLKSDVLISPHHGSKTSSSVDFLQAVAPKFVVISSGYKNRFKHPAKVVTQRYQRLGTQVFDTACSGQIDIILDDKISVSEVRKDHARYYQHQCQSIDL